MKHENLGILVDECCPKCRDVGLNEAYESIEKEVLSNLSHKKRRL